MKQADEPGSYGYGTITDPTYSPRLTSDDLRRIVAWGQEARSQAPKNRLTDRWRTEDAELLVRLTDAHRFLLDIGPAQDGLALTPEVREWIAARSNRLAPSLPPSGTLG